VAELQHSTPVSIANLKFLLICFEILSVLKINFLKSEVIVMGVSQEEQTRVAHALNCREGAFPFTYLGFLMADRPSEKYFVEISDEFREIIGFQS
jgi:hypothetical protein